VEQLCDSGLCCFYSQLERLVPDPPSVKQAAFQFHGVVTSVFDQAAVIPFRFPTLVAQLDELRSHLQENSAEYREALVRLRGLVEFELRVIMRPDAPHLPSGTEYLRTKQGRDQMVRAHASNIRQYTQEVLAGWREREIKDGRRCYALVARSDVPMFLHMIRFVDGPVGIETRVSGPWPATEFISAEPQ